MRICLYGGPGVGKSLLSLHLAERLARDGYGIELVQEAIKPLAYKGTTPGAWVMKDVFDEQFRRERDWIGAGVPHLVTDSPLFLACYYLAARGLPEAAGCLRLARDFARDHPSFDVFLERSPSIAYREAGRYQSASEAAGVDASMRSFLESEGVRFAAFDASDRFAIREAVAAALSRPPEADSRAEIRTRAGPRRF